MTCAQQGPTHRTAQRMSNFIVRLRAERLPPESRRRRASRKIVSPKRSLEQHTLSLPQRYEVSVGVSIGLCIYSVISTRMGTHAVTTRTLCIARLDTLKDITARGLTTSYKRRRLVSKESSCSAAVGHCGNIPSTCQQMIKKTKKQHTAADKTFYLGSDSRIVCQNSRLGP